MATRASKHRTALIDTVCLFALLMMLEVIMAEYLIELHRKVLSAIV